MAELWSALFFVVTAGLIVGSVAVWILWIRKLLEGRSPVPRRFRRDRPSVPTAAVALTLVWLFIHFAVTLLPTPERDFDADRMVRVVVGSVIEGTIITVVLLGVLLWSTRQRTQLVRLGFRLDEPLGQTRAGIVGFLAAFAPVLLVLLVSLPLRTVETMHPFLRLATERGFGTEILWIILAAVVVAPLKEELLFRVVLQTWLEGLVSRTGALVGTAVLFSAVHGFPDSVAIFPLALVIGYIYQQRRSFLAAVVLHALFNAYNVTAVLLVQLDF